jgi:hypothetical protein
MPPQQRSPDASPSDDRYLVLGVRFLHRSDVGSARLRGHPAIQQIPRQRD